MIGGGPAGATVSRILAENDVDVLLFEKKKVIGLPVRCGELLPHPSEMRCLFPKVKDAEELIGPPKNTLANVTEYTELIDPIGNKIKSRFKSNIVFRDKYDQALVKRAMDAGVVVKCGCPVISVSGNGSVRVNDMGTIKQVKARVIVGADGPRSLLTEGFRENYEFSVCYVSIMENVNVDENVVQMYFGKEYAPGAYAWIIPKGKHVANVGLGIRKHFSDSIKIKKEHVFVKNLTLIIDTTLKLSINKGFQEMSLRDLCKKSGLSMGALYSYISSKDHLVAMVHAIGQRMVIKVMKDLLLHVFL